MYIYAEVVTPNGASARVHRIFRVDISEEVRVHINSYASSDSELAVWQDIYTMPVSQLSTMPYPESVYTWLASPSGPFSGGTLLNNPGDFLRERVRVMTEISRERDLHIGGGVTTPVGRVDSDQVSIRNVMGSYQSAALALVTKNPFEVAWRLADNEMVTLDAMGMIQMGNAVLAHVKDCYARSWVLKAEVEAATTVEELAEISIETGWPD